MSQVRLIESYERRNTKILQAIDKYLDLDALYTQLTSEIYNLKKSQLVSDEDFTLLAYLNYLQGKINRYRLNFIGALHSLKKAEKVMSHSILNAHMKAKINFHLSLVYLNTKEKSIAHEYLLEAMLIFSNEGNNKMLSRVQKLLGTLSKQPVVIKIEEMKNIPKLDQVNRYIKQGKYLDKHDRLIEANFNFITALDLLNTSENLYFKPEGVSALISIVNHYNHHHLWEDAKEILNKFFQFIQQRFRNNYLVFSEVYEMNLANEKISINYEQLVEKNEQLIEYDTTLALIIRYKNRIGVIWNGDSYKIAQYYKNLAYLYLKFIPHSTKARNYANRSMRALSKLKVLQKKSVLLIIKQLLAFFRYIKSTSECRQLEEIIDNKKNILLVHQEPYFPDGSLNFSLSTIYKHKPNENNLDNFQLLPVNHMVYSRELTLFLKIIPINFNQEDLDEEISFFQKISQNRILRIHETNFEFIAFEPILADKKQKKILQRVRTEHIRTEILEILKTMKDLYDLYIFVGNINTEMFYIAAKEKQLKIGIIEEFMSYKYRFNEISLKRLKRLWRRSKNFKSYSISPEAYILDKLGIEVFYFNKIQADKFSFGASLLYLVTECSHKNSNPQIGLRNLYEKHIKTDKAAKTYEIDDGLQLDIYLMIDEIELFDWIKPTLKSLMKVNWHNRTSYEKIISVYEEDIKVSYCLLNA